MSRRSSSGLTRSAQVTEARARCHDCGWSTTGRNAVGLAAQHAKRNGHRVLARQSLEVVFSPPPPSLPLG